MLRIRSEHRAVASLGLLGIADCLEREAEIVEQTRMPGRTRERTPVARDGGAVLPALALAVAEMKQRFRMVGIKSGGLAPGIFGSGMFPAAEGALGAAQQPTNVCRSGHGLERLE